MLSKGPEYSVSVTEFEIDEGQTTDLEIGLERWTDMPAAGWYSGDGHVHIARDRDDNRRVSHLMQAEDLHVTNMLQMGNPAGTHFRQYAFGPAGRHVDGRHALVSGVEDPRTAVLGHTISLNIREVVRDAGIYLRYDRIFDAYAAQGGLSGFAHLSSQIFNVRRGLALYVPLGAVDFIEILQDGELDTDLWYRFLDLGFRLTPVAGSDYPYLGQPGSERNYVHVGDEFSVDAWYSKLKSGATFVTNGPLIEFDVAGRGPGSTVEASPGDRISIRAIARQNPGLEPLDRIELVIHGDVAATATAGPVTGEIMLQHTITVGHGSWIAVRAFGEHQTSAHTAPVYVVTGESGSRNDERAPAIIDGLMHELAELDTLQVDVGTELEGWSVGPTLEAMLENQRAQLLQSADEARRIYEAILDDIRTRH